MLILQKEKSVAVEEDKIPPTTKIIVIIPAFPTF
jgi:hypothetical protein